MDHELRFLAAFCLIATLSLDFSTGNRANGVEQDSVKWSGGGWNRSGEDFRASGWSNLHGEGTSNGESLLPRFGMGSGTNKGIKTVEGQTGNGTKPVRSVTEEKDSSSCRSFLNFDRRPPLKWWQMQRTLHCLLEHIGKDLSSFPERRSGYPWNRKRTPKGKNLVRWRETNRNPGKGIRGERHETQWIRKGGRNRNRKFPGNQLRNNGKRREGKIVRDKGPFHSKENLCCREDTSAGKGSRKVFNDDENESDKKVSKTGIELKSSVRSFHAGGKIVSGKFQNGGVWRRVEYGKTRTKSSTSSERRSGEEKESGGEETGIGSKTSTETESDKPDKGKKSLSGGSKSKTWPHFVYHLVSSNFLHLNEKTGSHHPNAYVAISVADSDRSGTSKIRKP